MPTPAIAARSCCSDCRTSGRRCSSVDESPMGSASGITTFRSSLARSTRSGNPPASTEIWFSFWAICSSRFGTQRRGARQLDLRLLVVRLGGQTPFETQPRLFDTLLAGLHRTVDDLQLVVQRHQLEVGRGHLGHQRHLQRPGPLDRGQILGRTLAFGPPQAPPQVGLPAQTRLDADFGIVRELRVSIVVRLAVGIGRPVDRRQTPRPCSRGRAPRAGARGRRPTAGCPVVFERAF